MRVITFALPDPVHIQIPIKATQQKTETLFTEVKTNTIHSHARTCTPVCFTISFTYLKTVL